MQEFLALNTDARIAFVKKPFIVSRIDKVNRPFTLSWDVYVTYWLHKTRGCLLIMIQIFFIDRTATLLLLCAFAPSLLFDKQRNNSIYSQIST